MNKYVILSTDNTPEYYQLLPSACHSWQKIGYTPIIISVNISKELIILLHAYCPDALILNHPSTEGVKDSTMAQLYRLWPPCENDEGIVITADADMVIARDIFTHDVSQGQIVSYGYDLTGRSELPICYVKATAAKWRELMGEFTIPEAAYSDDWNRYWSTDQQLLTQRAREYGMDKIMFVDRGNQNKHGLPTGRWDRYDWAHIPDSIIDVHMKRNSWEAQIEVAERLWPGEDHSFITKFREALEGYEITDEKKEVKIKMDGVEIKALAADTKTLDKLMEATKDIAEAYNYPAQLIESYGVELKAPISIEDIQPLEVIRINIDDEFGFLNTTGNWDNHRPLLLLALSLTKGKVTECGAGEGSTPYLRAYCKKHNRQFNTYDNNLEWANKMNAGHVWDWDAPARWLDIWAPCGLLFVDHAPGEHRKVAIERMMDRADIIVVHDSEQGGAGDYGFEPVFSKFKYRLNYNKSGGGAGATAVSNKIDLNQFRGLKLGQYQFDND